MPDNSNYNLLQQQAKQERQAAFLRIFQETGIISTACDAIGIDRSTYYLWMEMDSDFAFRSNQAREIAIERMEDEARKRAMIGVTREEGVYFQGARIDVKKITEYSDTLLIFLLKGARPDKYRDRFIQDPAGTAVKVVDAEAWESV